MQEVQVRLGSLVRDNRWFYFYRERKNVVELVDRDEAPRLCKKDLDSKANLL